MKFSIVIPTYNRRETLATVLPSLINQDFPKEEYEIFLSDSGSKDGTAELIQELNAPNIKFIVGENKGRGGARNRGIRMAQGEYILFTDADIIATPSLVSEHARFHEENPGCGVVGCEVQVDSLEEYNRVREDPHLFRTLHPESRKRLSWLYFLTGNASAPKKDLIEVGMFDEDFTGYGHEDLELGYRLEQAGLPIFYNPRAINFHWHPVSFEEQCQKMKMAGVSTVRFYEKHKDPYIKLLLGWNPLSFAWFKLLSPRSFLYQNFLEKARKEKRGEFFYELICQHHYLTGIHEAQDKGTEEPDKKI